jgi:hypothetical protein
VANFLGGYVFGEPIQTLQEFNEFYNENENLHEMKEFFPQNTRATANDYRKISRTDQCPSTITFGLSSVANDSPSQRLISNNFLTVPSIICSESPRPSFSNVISAEFNSTQFSNVPLVTVPKAPILKKKREQGVFRRIGEAIVSYWNQLISFMFLRKLFTREFWIQEALLDEAFSSPIQRLRRIKTETHFTGFVY